MQLEGSLVRTRSRAFFCSVSPHLNSPFTSHHTTTRHDTPFTFEPSSLLPHATRPPTHTPLYPTKDLELVELARGSRYSASALVFASCLCTLLRCLQLHWIVFFHSFASTTTGVRSWVRSWARSWVRSWVTRHETRPMSPLTLRVFIRLGLLVRCFSGAVAQSFSGSVVPCFNCFPLSFSRRLHFHGVFPSLFPW